MKSKLYTHNAAVGIANLLLICIIFLNVFTSNCCESEPKRFVIITASYNNKDWYERNLLSVFNQTYPHWHLIYIDDCSPDGTGQLVEDFVQFHGMQDRVTLIKNSERQYHLANQYYAIHPCDGNEIVIIVDADDWLIHNKVLEHLNKVYSNSDVWMTYGQFKTYPKMEGGFSETIPYRIIKENGFRKYNCRATHLRTYYAWLFQKIEKNDLMKKDLFFRAAADVATMIPMLEMAGIHSKFIRNYLYIYNRANSQRANRSEQCQNDKIVRKRKRYRPLKDKYDVVERY